MSTNDKSDRAKKILDSYWTLLVTFLFVGPFCLPLLWRNPRFTRKEKVVWTVVMLAATVLIVIFFGETLQQGYRDYQQLKQMLESQ